MPRKKPEGICEWVVDGHPVWIELYDSVIKIRDEKGNQIDLDKRTNDFRMELHGKFSFWDGMRKGKAIKKK
jgi:hypothetical protein